LKIEADIQSGSTDFCGRYYYNGLFNRTEKDRIIQILREFDVGDAVLPMTDSRLSFLDPKTPDFRQLFLDFETSRRPDLGRVRVDEDDLKSLYDAKPRSPEERTPEALFRAESMLCRSDESCSLRGINLTPLAASVRSSTNWCPTITSSPSWLSSNQEATPRAAQAGHCSRNKQEREHL